MTNYPHTLAADEKKACRIKEIPGEKDNLDSSRNRSPYIRDRDRILYSKPFRRLAYKTQVYVTSEMNEDFDEHCRTRLSHTLEVNNIGRRIAHALGLNKNLVEAIALGHDVGHTPFGHAGEQILNDFLQGEIEYPIEALKRAGIKNSESLDLIVNRDNFNHSFQSVRVLTSYNDYSKHDCGLGLRLTYQTLNGILKHTQKYKERCVYPTIYRLGKNNITFNKLILSQDYQSIEASIVAIADEIAQVVHDIADAIKVDLIDLQTINSGEIRKTFNRAYAFYRKATGSKTKLSDLKGLKPDILAHQITSCLTDLFSEATISIIEKIINTHGMTVSMAIDKIGTVPYPISVFEKIMKFKNEIILNSREVVRMDNKGKAILKEVLHSYIVEPRQLPDVVLDKISESLPLPDYRLKTDYLERITKVSGSGQATRKDVIKLSEILGDPNKNNIRYLDKSTYNTIYPVLITSRAFRRMLVDYVSQMTDNFAEEEHKRLRT